MRKVRLPDAFRNIDEVWSPHIAGRVNGQEIRIARIHGAFEWHKHEAHDEAFYVVKGAFRMGVRDGDGDREEAMAEGDLIVIPAGVEHRPVADEECWILLIDAPGELNTGDIDSDLTRRNLPDISAGAAVTSS